MKTETARLAHMYADKVNKMIADYEASDQSGIQTFGAELRKTIKGFGLAKQETMHHSKVCPHEDNRDGELLIPIAVWKLLLMITRKGWSPLECSLALACGIPSNEEGDRWKAKAMQLAEQIGRLACTIFARVAVAGDCCRQSHDCCVAVAGP